MTWTTTPPDRPGWYWFRAAAVTAEVVQVFAVDAPWGFVVYMSNGHDYELPELMAI